MSDSDQPAATNPPQPDPDQHLDVSSVEAEPSVDILQLAVTVAKHKKQIFVCAGVAALISIVVALLIPNSYTGTAVIMPPRPDPSNATALLGDLLGKGGYGGGIATALGLQNPNDLYVGVLKSRTVADKLIVRFKLQELYGEDTLVETREELEDRTNVTASKDGLIKISFEDRDPARAAAVANAYVEELERLTADLAMSDASRRRKHFQEQVELALASLTKADQGFRTVQEQTGLIKPSEQAQAIFGAISTVRAEIAAKEIELTAMKVFATSRNPDYIRTQEQLTMMRSQLALLEKTGTPGAGDILIPITKVPEAGVRFIEQWRQVKYYETVYELLSRQLEVARIDEGRNATIIQHVDKAVQPDKKSKPKRTLIVLAATLLGGVLGVLWVLVKEGYNSASLDPRRGHLLAQLVGHIRLRR